MSRRGTSKKEKLIPRRGRGTAEKEKLIPRRGRGTAEKEKLIPRRGRGTAEKKTSKYDKKKCLPTKYDPIYRKKVILMLGNRILKHGKKSLAYKILYRAMKEMKQKTEIDPISVLRQAIEKVTPRVALQTRAKRTGEGSTYQVPKEVAEKEGRITAIRWLLKASRKRTGQNMAFRLSSEFVDATKKRGNAIRKKEEIYKMTQATRTFAYVRESLHF